jgi:DNA-directed RNA polymerase specialized sigma subunit
MTLAEIGQVIGVGESRVSQLRSLAISRLRTSLREALGLRDQAA